MHRFLTVRRNNRSSGRRWTCHIRIRQSNMCRPLRSVLHSFTIKNQSIPNVSHRAGRNRRCCRTFSYCYTIDVSTTRRFIMKTYCKRTVLKKKIQIYSISLFKAFDLSFAFCRLSATRLPNCSARFGSEQERLKPN